MVVFENRRAPFDRLRVSGFLMVVSTGSAESRYPQPSLGEARTPNAKPSDRGHWSEGSIRVRHA